MTNSQRLTVDSVTLHIAHLGLEESPVQLIWAHGWGQSLDAMQPLAEGLARTSSSFLIDFPGFGQSPAPPDTWDTATYADNAAHWLATLPPACRIWIGHSFGCRVGLQLAARHPGLVNGMVLIAAAGLQRRRSLKDQLRYQLRVRTFKLAKLFVPEGPRRDALRARFGSADYRNAGPMRSILSKVVREDLTEVAKQIACPALLIYGENDVDTPPEIGERLQRLIPNASLTLLPGLDHHTVLSSGRNQVLVSLKKFVESLCGPSSR